MKTSGLRRLGHAARPGAVGGPHPGPAVPHRPGAVRTLLGRAAARPRRSPIGRAKPFCRSTDGCRTAPSSWSPTAPLPPSNSSPPTSSPRHRPKAGARTAAGRGRKAAQSCQPPQRSRHALAAAHRPLWYSQINRTIEFASGTALWYRRGSAPVPIRWVLVRAPDGVLEPQAFPCTNTEADPTAIPGWFIMRWQVEATFEGNPRPSWRRGLAPMVRPTPALFGLFPMVCLWAHDINAMTALIPRTAA